jgi:hypothetical protein
MLSRATLGVRVDVTCHLPDVDVCTLRFDPYADAVAVSRLWGWKHPVAVRWRYGPHILPSDPCGNTQAEPIWTLELADSEREAASGDDHVRTQGPRVGDWYLRIDLTDGPPDEAPNRVRLADYATRVRWIEMEREH